MPRNAVDALYSESNVQVTLQLQAHVCLSVCLCVCVWRGKGKGRGTYTESERGDEGQLFPLLSAKKEGGSGGRAVRVVVLYGCSSLRLM